MTGKGYRCPQQRAEYLEGKEPRRASHHGSHLSKEATFINPAVILSYGGDLPSAETNKRGGTKKKCTGGEGERSPPTLRRGRQARDCVLAPRSGASVSPKQ